MTKSQPTNKLTRKRTQFTTRYRITPESSSQQGGRRRQPSWGFNHAEGLNISNPFHHAEGLNISDPRPAGLGCF